MWPFRLYRYRVEYRDRITSFQTRWVPPKPYDTIDTPDGPLIVVSVPVDPDGRRLGTIKAEPVAPSLRQHD